MGEREVDQELVFRVQQGDKKAFDLLVLKYQQKVANLVSRYIRDQSETLDVTQEAFIKAYRALPNFRGECFLHLALSYCHQYGEKLSGRSGASSAGN